MHFANYFNLTRTEFITVVTGASFLISLATLVAILLVMRKSCLFQKGKLGRWDEARWKEWAQESESICQSFSKHLEAKREMGKRLIEHLDEKMERLQALLTELEAKGHVLPKGGSQNDRYGQVLEMARAGLDASEIVKRSNLPRGEVELILGLNQYCQP